MDPDTSSQDKEPSKQLQEYVKYFSSDQSPSLEGLCQRVSRRQIFYDPKSDFEGVRVLPVNAERRGAIVHFRADIGKFTLMVQMLNVEEMASRICKREMHRKKATCIQQRQSMTSGSYVSKRFMFTEGVKTLQAEKGELELESNGIPDEIKDAVAECAYAKLCAALGIGLEVGSPDHFFDLVCYSDCIEFFMEKGTVISDLPSASIQDAEFRLRYCVQVMHMLGLIHKDIKPNNILATDDGVIGLADFGISTHVCEKPGQTSRTFKQGTKRFMSPEMQRVPLSGCGDVDLYYNDMWGLKATIWTLRQTENFNYDILLPAKRGDTWKVMSNCDQAIFGLTCRLEGIVPNNRQKEAIAQASRFFGNYFREFGKEVNEKDFNLDFLLRCFDQPKKLLYFIDQQPIQSTQTGRLVQRLLKRGNFCLRQMNFTDQKKLLLDNFQGAQALCHKASVCSSNQLRKLFNVGLKLSSVLLQTRQYEQSIAILVQLEPFAARTPKDIREKLCSQKILVQLFRPTPDLQIIQNLISNAGKNIELLDAVEAAFKAEQYKISLKILSLFCAKDLTQFGETAEEVVNCIQCLLSRYILTLDKHICCKLINIFRGISKTCILNIPAAYFDKLSTEVRLQLQVLNVMSMSPSAGYEEKMKILDTAELIASQQPGYPLYRVLISMKRCESMFDHGKYTELRSILFPTLRYVRTTLGNFGWMVWTLERILAQLQYAEGEFEEAVDSVFRSIVAIKPETLLSVSYLTSITRLLSILRFLVCKSIKSHRIEESVTLIAEIIRERQADADAQPESFLQIHLGLGFLFTNFGKETSSHYEDMAVNLLNRTNAKNAAVIGNILLKEAQFQYKSSNCRKGHQYALLVVDLVDRYYEQLERRAMLTLGRAVTILRRQGSSILANRLIEQAISKLGQETSGSEVQLQYELAHSCFNARMFTQSYTLAKPLMGKHPLATALTARSLFTFPETQQSEALFLDYLANKPNDNSQLTHKMTIDVCNDLRVLYSQRSNLDASSHYLRMTLEGIRTFRHVSGIDEQAQMFIEIFIRIGNMSFSSKLFHTCLYRLEQLANHTYISAGRKMSIVQNIIGVCHHYQRYGIVMNYLRVYTKSVPLTSNQPDLLVKLAFASVITRKPRRFYELFEKVKRCFPDATQQLTSFLAQRREYIKLYVVTGFPPKESKILSSAETWLAVGLPSQHFKQPVSQRLR